MKIFSRVSKFCAAFVFAIATILASFSPVYAADETPAYGISISPVTMELEDLSPGDSTSGTFTIKNTGQNKCNYKIVFEPYTVEGDDYEPTLDKKTAYNDIIDWATFSSESGTLEPQESKDITFIITVPDDVPAGGQYGAIIAETTNDSEASDSASISLGRRVGMIVYSQVSGQTRIAGDVEENKISGFLFKPPISATSIIENTGNTHITATYTLQVFPLFSDEEVYSNEDDPETNLILPETRRFNTISWDGAPHFGIFKVRQTINAFGKDDVTEKIVVLCPLWLLFVLILIIVCIIFWIVMRIRARKQ